MLDTIKVLSDVDVDLRVGTDASVAQPFLGGLAHGASVHHELQHLVRAGLTPVQALRAATATTAPRFRLTERGRIAEGLRADLLLVDGDPTTISDTLNTRAVWRRHPPHDQSSADSRMTSSPVCRDEHRGRRCVSVYHFCRCPAVGCPR